MLDDGRLGGGMLESGGMLEGGAILEDAVILEDHTAGGSRDGESIAEAPRAGEPGA
jgi:hypothetical protein